MDISRRLARLSDSTTMAITARAAALKAEGRNVIGFGAGEPDFPTPAHIVAAAQEAAADPMTHHYSPAAGLPALREAVAANTTRDTYRVTANQVVITAGGKGALFGAFAALLDPGDEVLMSSPYWVSHPEAVALADGVPVIVETTPANGFRLTPETLDAAFTERTKALLFVSPSNPTGTVYTPAEVGAIGRWAAKRGIWVVTDEIYEHLVYGDSVFSSIPVEVPEIAERCVVVNGVAKTYAMTGWRVGWLVAPPEVADAVGRFQSHSLSNVANVSQRAALAAVTGPQGFVAEMKVAFDRRRLTMYRMLGEIPGISLLEPEGAFYCWAAVTDLLGTEIGGHEVKTSEELAAALLEVAEIAIIPGEAFGAPGYLRFSFALGDEDLEEGLTRFRQAVG